jgi:hypothetical protein
MWLALVLPLLVLPALVGFSRFEQRMMGGPGAPGAAQQVRVQPAPGAGPR